MSELAEPIRELCKDKVPFNWGLEHQAAFKQMKREIVRAPILAYYNPKKETVLQTDASIKGLGACLLQDQKPVYFASKALTETQCGYVAIEIESLAVAWAMEKFHHFLYASHFILETDQKPLEAILSKSLNQATPLVAENPNQNFPLHIHCTIHSRNNKPACGLLVLLRWPKRYHQAAQAAGESDYKAILGQKQQFTAIKSANTS